MDVDTASIIQSSTVKGSITGMNADRKTDKNIKSWNRIHFLKDCRLNGWFILNKLIKSVFKLLIFKYVVDFAGCGFIITSGNV